MEIFNRLELEQEGMIRKGRKFFRLPENIDDLIKQQNIDFLSAGVFLGEEKKIFEPSVAGLQEAFVRQSRLDNTVKLNEKGEWMFTCGKDAFVQNLVEQPHAKIGDPVWVVNTHNEMIGLGILEKKQIRHLRDIGEFLRREK